MSNKPIIQMRDNQRTVVNAELIDGMIADDNTSKENLLKYGHVILTLYIAGQERKFFYDLKSEIEYKYYCDDVADIRVKLGRIGGLV